MSVFKRTTEQRDLSEVHAISGKRFEEDTKSMESKFKKGDIVHLKETPQYELRVVAVTDGFVTLEDTEGYLKKMDFVYQEDKLEAVED